MRRPPRRRPATRTLARPRCRGTCRVKVVLKRARYPPGEVLPVDVRQSVAEVDAPAEYAVGHTATVRTVTGKHYRLNNRAGKMIFLNQSSYHLLIPAS